MVSSELLEILRCPETMQKLTPAPQELLDRVGRAGLRDRSGNPVELPLAEGLLREDGAVLYAVRDGIPVMLIEESIPLPPELRGVSAAG